jgi:hypothetical protein
MIIAIDESGNFNTNSNKYNIFVAAHIQSQNGNLQVKKKQFESWENKVPANMRDKKGEIKGQLLGKVELKNFIKNVVFQKPEIRFSYVSLIPKKNEIELIKKHKNFEILQLQLSLENFKKAESKKANINFLEQLSKWLNKRNEIEYLKLLGLRNCLYDSLHNTFIYCEVFNLINELLEIEFKIDKDFISNEDNYWKMYSLRSIQELTIKRPLPMLKAWGQNHPIREKYVIKDKGFDLNIPFKENLKFLDSKENFEIRIADTAAIIYNRYWNGNGIKSHFENLSKKYAAKEEHHHLILNDFDFDKKIEDVKTKIF